jgi:hypothetical protein
MVFLTVFAGNDTCEGYESASAVTKCWATLHFNVPSYDRNNQVLWGAGVKSRGVVGDRVLRGDCCDDATLRRLMEHYRGVSKMSYNYPKPHIATAALTRGYRLDASHNYRLIIRRNRSLVRAFRFKGRRVRSDHFLFHEGNISILARVVIRLASLPLRLKFVNLGAFFEKFKLETNFGNISKCPETELSLRFSLGYRAMCAFWINEFLAYLDSYDVIFRIDEDCVLNSLNYETVLSPMVEGAVDYSAGMTFGHDDPGVTRGFEDFVLEWHKEHPGTRSPVLNLNPYTNLFLVRPKAINSNPDALAFLHHVRSSGCVLNNRWGDHVVWGALLNMYGNTLNTNLTAEVSYFHGSHGTQVSGGQQTP